MSKFCNYITLAIGIACILVFTAFGTAFKMTTVAPISDCGSMTVTDVEHFCKNSNVKWYWSNATKSCLKYFEKPKSNNDSIKECRNSAPEGMHGRLAVILTDELLHTVTSRKFKGWIGLYVKKNVTNISDAINGFPHEWEWRDGDNFISNVNYANITAVWLRANANDRCSRLSSGKITVGKNCTYKISRVCEYLLSCFSSPSTSTKWTTTRITDLLSLRSNGNHLKTANTTSREVTSRHHLKPTTVTSAVPLTSTLYSEHSTATTAGYSATSAKRNSSVSYWMTTLLPTSSITKDGVQHHSTSLANPNLMLSHKSSLKIYKTIETSAAALSSTKKHVTQTRKEARGFSFTTTINPKIIDIFTAHTIRPTKKYTENKKRLDVSTEITIPHNITTPRITFSPFAISAGNAVTTKTQTMPSETTITTNPTLTTSNATNELNISEHQSTTESSIFTTKGKGTNEVTKISKATVLVAPRPTTTIGPASVSKRETTVGELTDTVYITAAETLPKSDKTDLNFLSVASTPKPTTAPVSTRTADLFSMNTTEKPTTETASTTKEGINILRTSKTTTSKQVPTTPPVSTRTADLFSMNITEKPTTETASTTKEGINILRTSKTTTSKQVPTTPPVSRRTADLFSMNITEKPTTETASTTKEGINILRTSKTTTSKQAPTTPPFPMSKVQKAIVKVFQTLGCTFILGSLGITLTAFLILRDFSYERVLHMNHEIALLIAHLLVLTARDITHMPTLCKIVSTLMQFSFIAAFSFLALEALQTYAIMTSVTIRGGYCSRLQFFVIGWTGPAIIAAVSSLLMHDHYWSRYSCWLNIGSSASLTTFVPIFILFSATLVMTEAATMGDYPKLPGYDRNQATAAVANQKAMLVILPLNLASWLCGFIAVYYANFAMYSLVSTLNLLLGVSIFVFHSLGNPKVHALFKKFWSKIFRRNKIQSHEFA